jgi:hypothetical protein
VSRVRRRLQTGPLQAPPPTHRFSAGQLTFLHSGKPFHRRYTSSTAIWPADMIREVVQEVLTDRVILVLSNLAVNLRVLFKAIDERSSGCVPPDTCALALSTCAQALSVCVLALSTCVFALSTCVLALSACVLALSTCVFALSACVLALSTCELNLARRIISSQNYEHVHFLNVGG